jgi:O-antigen/teichoic acid export membrane protein
MSQIGGPQLARWFAQRHGSTRKLLVHSLGIDRPIAFTILARGWSSFAGLITVLLIARLLSPAEQGYYYTFGSLVALQIVFELGFSFVILQMASHEIAYLTITSNDHIEGSPVSHARLASVLQRSVRWYSAAAVFLAAFLVVAGSHFFNLHRQAGLNVNWQAPWITTAIAAAATFQLDPILSFMEGCGFVANVAKVRFAQAAIGSLLAWGVLVTHHGLFAPAMVVIGNATVALLWLSRHRRLLVGLLRRDPGPHRVHWFREVWPFQWRIAVSWLCGYFIYQLFNPVLFAYHGAVSAGQMGMSLSVANALQSVAISWINTKAAPLGGMIARKEYVELDRIFFRSLKQSVAVYCAGALLLLLGAVYLNIRHISLASRLLSPACLAGLLFVNALNITVFGQALYLRAHKQEKFLVNSIVAAILVALSTYFLGRYYGAPGIVTGNLIIAVFVGLPFGTYIFVKYRRIWHAECEPSFIRSDTA